MSMNLNLMAELLADTKIGKKVIHESFDLWQTPTDVTRGCLASGSLKVVTGCGLPNVEELTNSPAMRPAIYLEKARL